MTLESSRTQRGLRGFAFGFITFLVGAGCSSPGTEAPEPPVVVTTPDDNGGKGDVFGEDDRGEPYRYREASPVRLASQATAAQIWSSNYGFDGDVGNYTGRVRTMAERFDLCEEHPFSNQPSVAICTAFLVAPDLLVTAGHCVHNKHGTIEEKCADTSWVFGFSYENEQEEEAGAVPDFTRDDVYTCAEVVAFDYHGCSADYAVVRLDRPVEGVTPLVVAPERPELGEDVWALGFPSGVPMKISPGGVVDLSKYTTSDSFETTVDGFGGNSGGPVVTIDGRVHGIHVCGNPRGEYEPAEGQDCSLPFVCDTVDECVGMGTYAMGNIADFLDCLGQGGTREDCDASLPTFPVCNPLGDDCGSGRACQWTSPTRKFRCVPESPHRVEAGGDCYFRQCEDGSVCRKQSDSTADDPNFLCIPLCSDAVPCESGTCQPAGNAFDRHRFCSVP